MLPCFLLRTVSFFAHSVGGRVAVESNVGQGKVRLRLPFGRAHLGLANVLPPEPATDDAAVLPAEQLPIEEPPLTNEPPTLATRPRLLVVEDNDEVREYLPQLFLSEYEVLTASDGRQGWEQALHHLPALMVSDVMMPRFDGI